MLRQLEMLQSSIEEQKKKLKQLNLKENELKQRQQDLGQNNPYILAQQIFFKQQEQINQNKEISKQNSLKEYTFALQKLKDEKQEVQRELKLMEEQLQKSQFGQQFQSTKQDISIITSQIKTLSQICFQQPIEQISFIQSEIEKINDSKILTSEQKKYHQAIFSSQLLVSIRQSGQYQPISIPHMNQLIEKNNPDVLFYVLKESLLRDQNKELLRSNIRIPQSLDQLIGAYGEDQSCLRFRTNQIDYDKLIGNDNFREKYLLQFKEKVAKAYSISIDQIEVLGISKGSSIISFQIKNRADIQNDQERLQFLEKVCQGSVEYYNYYVGTNQGQQLGLSSEDFNPSFNMSWDNLPEKEERGPPYHRYQYYFPKGCQGFGLNIDIKGYGNNQDWLQMNGNQNEWRILFHGTKQHFVCPITKTNLQPGVRNQYENDDCIDEYGKVVKVGKGIYFSDRISVCINDGYATPVQVSNKKFSVILMSRVNPKKIRQSDAMKTIFYFVVNESQDIRPYRLLLKEVP